VFAAGSQAPLAGIVPPVVRLMEVNDGSAGNETSTLPAEFTAKGKETPADVLPKATAFIGSAQSGLKVAGGIEDDGDARPGAGDSVEGDVHGKAGWGSGWPVGRAVAADVHAGL